MSGADAISGLTHSIDIFGDKVCSAMAMDPLLRTPARRKEALTLAQRETWLPLGDRLLFYNVLERDVRAIDAYVSIDGDDQEFRELWILSKVDAEKGRLSRLG